MKWTLTTLLIVAATIGALVFYAFNTHLFPRFGMPAFDHAKASRLGAAQRAAYEQELFSELFSWNYSSARYQGVPEGKRKRTQRWQEMADEGFELAHITLRVLSPGNVFSLVGPMRRLEELAEQGDVGAMCLMPSLAALGWVDNIDHYRPMYRRWLVRGAELGHPECLLRLGARTLRGVDGFERDVERGLATDFTARRMGYSHGVGTLVEHFRSKGLNDVGDVRRQYCWLFLEQQQWGDDGYRTSLWALGEKAQRSGRSDLIKLHGELRDRAFALDDCLNMGTGE